MNATVGRIVHVRLSEGWVNEIHRRRTTSAEIKSRIGVNLWPLGAQAHLGGEVKEGDILPAIVVKVWSTGVVNLRVILDGTDEFWATSVTEGELPGQWFWPPRE